MRTIEGWVWKNLETDKEERFTLKADGFIYRNGKKYAEYIAGTMGLHRKSKTHYISDGTWFDKGTEAYLLIALGKDAGLFRGLHNGEWDEESCLMEEFTIKEDK